MFKCLNASILKYITLVFRWKDLTFPVQISHSSQVRFKSHPPPPSPPGTHDGQRGGGGEKLRLDLDFELIGA